MSKKWMGAVTWFAAADADFATTVAATSTQEGLERLTLDASVADERDRLLHEST